MAVPNPKRFATLLRVRKHEADQRAWALADTQRRLQAAELERTKMYEEQKRMFARAAELTREHFDAQDIQRYYQHERHLARLASEKDAHIRELRRELAERRGELEAAMVQKRIAERLDERSHKTFEAFVRDQEQKLQDEVAVRRSWRSASTVMGQE